MSIRRAGTRRWQMKKDRQQAGSEYNKPLFGPNVNANDLALLSAATPPLLHFPFLSDLAADSELPDLAFKSGGLSDTWLMPNKESVRFIDTSFLLHPIFYVS